MSVDEYRELDQEHDQARTRAVVDHRQAWQQLPLLKDVNGTAGDRVQAFAEQKRISLEALVALGTRVKVDAHGGVELAWGYETRGGIVSAVKFRPVGDKKRYTLAPSVFQEPLVLGNRLSLDWFLAEGETDACRLYDLVGDAAAVLVLPAGAMAFRREWAAGIPRGATVYLAHDADTAGDGGAGKAAAVLGGNTVRVRPPDGCKDWCEWPGDRGAFVQLVAELRAAQTEPGRPFAMTIQEFIQLERPTAEPLIVDSDGRPLIAQNSLTLLGALGGAGKTTLFIDLAFHLAAGVDYLGFTVPRPASVLLIENEGPEEMFSLKIEEKLRSFPHELKARIGICTVDWGGFTLADPRLRDQLREELATHEYGLVFGDPLDSLGIEGVGSPEDTRKFLELMKETGLHKTVAWWLNTHPRKEETREALNEIAGAWGGKPDAVLLLKMLDDDRSQVRFPKIRWAKRGKRPSILLAFDADTETFSYLCEEGDDERDYLAEISSLLADGKWRTVKEIAAKQDADPAGIGAAETTVKKLLETHPEVFASATGEAAKLLGRHPSATVWQVTSEVHSGQNAPNAPCEFSGEDEVGATCAALISAAGSCTQLTTSQELSSPPNASPAGDEGGVA